MRSIDADELMKLYENPPGLNIDNFSVPISVIRQNIQDMPTIESAEVVHGEWITLDECSNAGVYCSKCNKKVYKENYANVNPKSNYCPNCGAKMDGGKE